MTDTLKKQQKKKQEKLNTAEQIRNFSLLYNYVLPCIAADRLAFYIKHFTLK